MVIDIPVFLDTNVIVAYYNEMDSLHSKAKTLMKNILEGIYGLVVISDYIFDEAVTVTLARTGSLEIAAMLGEYLLNSEILIIKVDNIILGKAWKGFKSQGSLKMSFTDWTSAAIMDIYGFRYIATFDNEFKKIGLKVL